MTEPRHKEGDAFVARHAHPLMVIVGKTMATPRDETRVGQPIDDVTRARVVNSGSWSVGIISCVHLEGGPIEVTVELDDAVMEAIATARAELRARMS